MPRYRASTPSSRLALAPTGNSCEHVRGCNSSRIDHSATLHTISRWKDLFMRVLIVFGTRPEAIKMAPVVQRLRETPGLDLQVCVTAQHREMLDQVLSLFDIVPDIDLDIMKPGQDLTDITANIILALRDVLKEGTYDRLLVHGDTTTTMAGALAAFYAQVPVGHVEAGLRTGNLYAPWPEEANRMIVGRIADMHFAPTQTARQSLLKENVADANIVVTGNTVIDALHQVVARLDNDRELDGQIESRFPFLDTNRRMILVTGHRRENFGKGFENICRALRDISELDNVQIVYPVHLNPNVQAPVNRILGDTQDVHLIEPQEYLPFVASFALYHYGLRRRSGRGTFARQAGAGDAQHHRTARSGRRRNRATGRH